MFQLERDPLDVGREVEAVAQQQHGAGHAAYGERPARGALARADRPDCQQRSEQRQPQQRRELRQQRQAQERPRPQHIAPALRLETPPEEERRPEREDGERDVWCDESSVGQEIGAEGVEEGRQQAGGHSVQLAAPAVDEGRAQGAHENHHQTRRQQ
jgi:hypothetical protein